MQLNSKLSKIAKTKYQQIFKNPQTDILYEKTKADILENICFETNQPKEELYKFLKITKEEWLQKLQDKNKITVRDIFTLAKAAQTTVDIGRPTNRCDFFETITDNDNFNNKLFEIIKDLSKKIDKESAEKNKKGLITRCCGSTIMNSIKDDENIQKNYSLDSSFEFLNQCLYAFSFCFEYTPSKPDLETERQQGLEMLADKTIDLIGFIPYAESEQEKNIKDKIKEFLFNEDLSILQLILNTKDKPDSKNIERLNAKDFVYLMAINGIYSFDNIAGTGESSKALEDTYKQISNKINQIPQNIKNIVSGSLNIPLNYFEYQPGQSIVCDTADYLLKMCYVTKTPLRFSPEYCKQIQSQYNEEKKTAYSIQSEKLTKPQKTTIITSNKQQEQSKEPDTINTTQNTKAKEMPEINELEQLKEKIKAAAENKQELLPFLLPLIREYFDINLDEKFKINNIEFSIKLNKNFQEELHVGKQKADYNKYTLELSNLATGNQEVFSYTEFNPKNGDTYWTFNIPVNLSPVKRIWGQNPYNDSISKAFNIIYKKESEIKRVDISKIQKQILG